MEATTVKLGVARSESTQKRTSVSAARRDHSPQLTKQTLTDRPHRQGLIKAILDIFFGPSSTTHGLPKLKGEAFQSRLELIVSSLMHSKTAEGVQLSLVLCTRIAFGFRTFHADGRGAVGPPPD